MVHPKSMTEAIRVEVDRSDSCWQSASFSLRAVAENVVRLCSKKGLTQRLGGQERGGFLAKELSTNTNIGLCEFSYLLPYVRCFSRNRKPGVDQSACSKWAVFIRSGDSQFSVVLKVCAWRCRELLDLSNRETQNTLSWHYTGTMGKYYGNR